MRNMIKVAAIVCVIGLFIVNSGCSAFDKSESATKQNIIEVGNKICPVMGEKVSGKDFYVYKGKRYGLCCSMCPATFASDPEKYSAIADKEVAGKK